MSWSRAEVQALAGKAARGAGAPPGQAALFGAAAALHLGQGRGAEALAEALEDLPDGPVMALPLVLQEVLPAAHEGRGAAFGWTGDADLARSYLETLPYDCRVEVLEPDRLKVQFTERSGQSAPLRRIAGCAPLLQHMTTLAARTFVPESDASRAGGAGAGVSDND
ncbi:hypothetical protein [Roseobacter sinensis]|uniref:Uncharacterized protein n=1 Tax=Roseobacter sinensis TaxID=2931391 RepID=A0ABT3BH63_9RHOB|nr:hypothetical protein [Roseobacter sp. WL0113]MCV3272921.1 hypothetical protein [Roseobacter sp. WL0113]